MSDSSSEESSKDSDYERDAFDSDDDGIVPEEMRLAAQEINLDNLPPKSKQNYTKAYNAFKQWRKEKHTNSTCEDVFLVYFKELSKKYAPTSLWLFYSMLKATFLSYEGISIEKYKKLVIFLRRNSRGYKGKKSDVFMKEDISKFLSEAPDEVYLVEKVNMSINYHS